MFSEIFLFFTTCVNYSAYAGRCYITNTACYAHMHDLMMRVNYAMFLAQARKNKNLPEKHKIFLDI